MSVYVRESLAYKLFTDSSLVSHMPGLLTTSENEEENGRYSERESNKLEVEDDFAEPVKKETDQDRMRDMFDSLKANNEDIEDLGSAYDWYLTSYEEDKRIRMADAGSSSPVESKPLAKAKEKESSLIKGKGKGREPPCEPLFDFGDEHHGLACTSDDEVVVIVDNSVGVSCLTPRMTVSPSNGLRLAHIPSLPIV